MFAKKRFNLFSLKKIKENYLFYSENTETVSLKRFLLEIIKRCQYQTKIVWPDTHYTAIKRFRRFSNYFRHRTALAWCQTKRWNRLQTVDCPKETSDRRLFDCTFHFTWELNLPLGFFQKKRIIFNGYDISMPMTLENQ